ITQCLKRLSHWPLGWNNFSSERESDAAVSQNRRQIMYALSYLRPSALEQAVSLMREHEEAKLLSGGMTVSTTLKQKLSAPSHLVDLSTLPELQGISINNDIVRIGSATRHVEVAQSATVAGSIPALAYLASQIADPQVRNRGTLGGSVANNDPAADYPS